MEVMAINESKSEQSVCIKHDSRSNAGRTVFFSNGFALKEMVSIESEGLSRKDYDLDINCI